MDFRKIIKDAYEKEGFDWYSIYQFVDNKGFLEMDILPEYQKEHFHHFPAGIIRPKTLNGFENNNGWTKLKMVKNLPKEDCLCKVILITGRETVAEYVKNSKEFVIPQTGFLCWKRISYYIELNENKKPFF